MTQPEQFYGECNVMLSYSFRLMSNKFNQCMCSYICVLNGRYKGIRKENCQKNEHSYMNERIGTSIEWEKRTTNLQHTTDEKNAFFVVVDMVGVCNGCLGL